MRSLCKKEMRMKRYTLGYVFLITIAIFAQSVSFVSAEIVDRIVATVNNEIITQTELNAAMEPYLRRMRSSGVGAEQRATLTQQIQKEVLDQLIDKKIAEQQVKQNYINVTDDVVNATINRIKEEQGLTDDQLLQTLERDGYTLASYKAHLKEQIQRSQLVDRMVRSRIVITEQDIRKYYDANKSQGGSLYTIRNIVLLYPNPMTQEDTRRIEARMNEVVQRFRNGESFATLARTYSQTSNSIDGGTLGSIPFASFAPPIQSMLQGVSVGDIAGPIDAGNSIQLFFVEAISQTTMDDYEKERVSIENKLYEQAIDVKYNEWITDVREKAHVTIHP